MNTDYEYVKKVKAEAMKVMERCDDWTNDESRCLSHNAAMLEKRKTYPDRHYWDKSVKPSINGALKRSLIEMKYVMGNVSALRR